MAKKTAKNPKPKKAHEEVNKGGRPSKRDDVDLSLLYTLASSGLTDEKMAPILGISLATLKNYKSDPRFLAVLKGGKKIADSKVVRSLYERACGYSHPDVDIRVIDHQIVKTNIMKHYPPDTTACIFWLKNRMPEQWRDKTESEVTGKDGGPIQHIAELSDAQLLQIIAAGSGQGAAKPAKGTKKPD